MWPLAHCISYNREHQGSSAWCSSEYHTVHSNSTCQKLLYLLVGSAIDLSSYCSFSPTLHRFPWLPSNDPTSRVKGWTLNTSSVLCVMQQWCALLNLSSSWGFCGLLLQMFLIGSSMTPDLLDLSPWRSLPRVNEGIHCKVTGSRSFTWAVDAAWTGDLPQKDNSCKLRLDSAETEGFKVQGLSWVILQRTQT